jgi:hypothetical protein
VSYVANSHLVIATSQKELEEKDEDEDEYEDEDEDDYISSFKLMKI